MSVIEIIALLFFTALAIMLWIIILNIKPENSESFREGAQLTFFATILTVFVATILIVEIVNPVTPIEVYRGNTTLKITYKDSVAIDSVVVWK